MTSNNRTKYLLKNTALFTLGNIATKLITFLLVPLYTFVLTTEEYGVVDLVITISSFLAPVLTANIGESVLRFALNKEENKERIMSVGLTCLLGAFIIGLIMIPGAKLFSPISEYGLYLYIFTCVSSIYNLLVCYLRGKEQILAFSVCTILKTFFTAIFNLIFLLIFKMGVQGYLLAYIAADVLTSIIAYIWGKVGKVLTAFYFDCSLARRMLRYSVVLIPNVFLWWIMDTMDRVVIATVLGVAANGIFAIAYKIPSILSTLTATFNQAWVYSAISEDNCTDKTEYFSSVYDSFFGIIIMMATGMLMVIKPFLAVYVADEYYIAWKYTPFLIVGFVFMSIGTFLSSSYNVNYDSKGFLCSAAVGAVINVIGNLTLVRLWGMNGVAFATALSYVGIFVYRYFDTKKYVVIKIFTVKNSILLLLLMLIAGSVYVPGMAGQLLLILEFLVVILLQWKIIYQILNRILVVLKSKKVS